MTINTMPTAIISGASSGVGLYATAALTARDWHVVMACRDPGKAATAATRLSIPVPADLGTLQGLEAGFKARTGVIFNTLYPGCVADTALFRDTPRIQREGRAPFSQPLSAKAKDAAAGARLWELNLGRVGL